MGIIIIVICFYELVLYSPANVLRSTSLLILTTVFSMSAMLIRRRFAYQLVEVETLIIIASLGNSDRLRD